MLRDRGVLVDASLDLERPVDELVFGKFIDDQLAVIRRVAPGGEPRDHVLPLARHHGEHEEVLGAAASPGKRMIM